MKGKFTIYYYMLYNSTTKRNEYYARVNLRGGRIIIKASERTYSQARCDLLEALRDLPDDEECELR